jgi:hypothetical protein
MGSDMRATTLESAYMTEALSKDSVSPSLTKARSHVS